MSAGPTDGQVFEATIKLMTEMLSSLGYRVETQQIFGHYRAGGEVWNQTGVAIRVYPFKDKD